MILTRQLILNSAQNRSKSALSFMGKDTTYKELLDSISRLSYLYQRDLGPSTRLAYFCSNHPTVVATFFAMSNIRAMNIPVDPNAPPEEVIKWLKESKATHLAVTSDLLIRAREVLHSQGLSLPIIEIDKKQGGEYDTSFTPPPDQAPLKTDLVLLLRTAGSTGKPRFAQFSHQQLTSAWMTLKNPYHLNASDRIHTSMNWYHPFAFVHSMLFPILGGSTCVIDLGLEGIEFLDFLKQSRVTRLINTPSFALKLLTLFKNEKRVLPGLKSITIGIGSLSPELKKAFDLLKISVSHCYGQTENLWTIAMQDTQNPEELLEGYTRGFVGKGLPGFKYKVINSTSDEIPGPDRRVGQLALTGPTVMKGYFEKEKETKAAIRGTWLYTGDLVQLEGEAESLTLTYLGRKEDILEINGISICLPEIEAAILRHPYVEDVGAFTLKNSKGEPVIACAIVKQEGSLLNESQILFFCKGNLAHHLIPVGVAFTEKIPRDLGNNVNCSKLRRQFSEVAG